MRLGPAFALSIVLGASLSVLIGHRSHVVSCKLGGDGAKAAVSRFEDAAGRGLAKVRRFEDQDLKRAQMFISEFAEDYEVVLVAEYKSGDVVVFQGGVDPKDDRTVTLPKAHAGVLFDTFDRLAKAR